MRVMARVGFGVPTEACYDLRGGVEAADHFQLSCAERYTFMYPKKK